MIPDQQIKFIRGQDLTLVFALDRPRSIVGWTISFTAKFRQSGETVLSKSATLVDTTRGVFSFALAAADTEGLDVTEDLVAPEEYFWDVKRTDSGAETVLAGGSLVLGRNATP